MSSNVEDKTAPRSGKIVVYHDGEEQCVLSPIEPLSTHMWAEMVAVGSVEADNLLGGTMESTSELEGFERQTPFPSSEPFFTRTLVGLEFGGICPDQTGIDATNCGGIMIFSATQLPYAYVHVTQNDEAAKRCVVVEGLIKEASSRGLMESRPVSEIEAKDALSIVYDPPSFFSGRTVEVTVIGSEPATYTLEVIERTSEDPSCPDGN